MIARHLAIDEGIEVDPDAIVVTVVAQETLFLVLRAMCVDKRDVILAVSQLMSG
ncbi:MAG: hypothetical protein H7240_02045 [Glaciimonas sp.]|nr:hypothetical protein [Glaciimonas sp.]